MTITTLQLFANYYNYFTLLNNYRLTICVYIDRIFVYNLEMKHTNRTSGVKMRKLSVKKCTPLLSNNK